MNLDAYFERIGWRGARDATFATLAGILDRHVVTIPFENIDVLLKNTPKLDLPSLEAKLVDARRGGYCYEHATLFAAVLQELGFDVATHSARVTMFVPEDKAPRTHMFLTVQLPEGRFVVDPGFGGLTPRVPVPLVDRRRAPPSGAASAKVTIDAAVGDHWIELSPTENRSHHLFALTVRTPEKTIAAWVSTLDRDYPIDFEMANWFTATSPLSPFTRGLRMRAFTEDGKVTVAGRTVTFADGSKRELDCGADLRPIVREYFGFDVPALDELELPAAP